MIYSLGIKRDPENKSGAWILHVPSKASDISNYGVPKNMNNLRILSIQENEADKYAIFNITLFVPLTIFRFGKVQPEMFYWKNTCLWWMEIKEYWIKDFTTRTNKFLHMGQVLSHNILNKESSLGPTYLVLKWTPFNLCMTSRLMTLTHGALFYTKDSL